MSFKIFNIMSLVSLLLGLSKANHFHRHYVPPSSAASAAGHGGFLQVPTSTQYLTERIENSHGGNAIGGASKFPIPILRNDFVNHGDGNYNFGFETGNGIRRDETGHLRTSGGHVEQVIEGSYTYTGSDGKQYTVTYKADSNGFQASGHHLPTPPPIPQEIAKSLALHQRGQQNNDHKSEDPSTQYLPPQQLQQRGYSYVRAHY